MKRGQFFEIDVLVAGLIIVASVILFSQTTTITQDSGLNELNQELDDLVTILNEVQTGELIAAETHPLYDAERSLARQILVYEVTGNEDKAKELIELINQTFIEQDRGFSFGLQGEELIMDAKNDTHNQRLSRSLFVTGVESNKPVEGFTGSLFLSKIPRTEPIIYDFGGFTGQGIIDVAINLEDVPSSNVTKLQLEGNFNANFTLSLNDYTCFSSSQNQVDTELYTCLDELQDGANNFRIRFDEDNISEQYLSGGNIKVFYETSNQQPYVSNRKYFPGIKGIFNLYDGMQVDETVSNIKANLNFETNLYSEYDQNNTFIFSIGDSLLLEEKNLPGGQIHNLNIEMSANQFSNTTVPFRVGFEDVVRLLEEEKNVDVAILTDVSGSMNFRFDNGDEGVSGRACNSSELFQNSTQRLNVAKCALHNLTNTLLQDVNNTVAMIEFSGGSNTNTEFTNNLSQIQSVINGYSPGGSTCISCAILKANELFKDLEEQNNREQVMLLMTDGEATRCAKNGGDDASKCGFEDEPLIRQAARDEAKSFANDTVINHNISIFTVAFAVQGVGASLMEEIASLTNPNNYYQGLNPESIITLYDEIGQSILQLGKFVSQVITGDFFQNSTTLYNTSYIEIQRNNQVAQEGILVNLEYDLQINKGECSYNVSIPSSVEPVRASMTSYSKQYWTHNITVNNQVQYDITAYSNPTQQIGDPFRYFINSEDLRSGINNIKVLVGNENLQETYCSHDNTFLLSAIIPRDFTEKNIFSEANGCVWTVEMQGVETDINLPADYAGTNTCSYTSTELMYNNDDLKQKLAFDLFSTLDDVNGDNRGNLPFKLSQDDIQFDFQVIEDLPFLWGPSVLEVSLSR